MLLPVAVAIVGSLGIEFAEPLLAAHRRALPLRLTIS
jgi:hypothetical protein